MKKIFLHIGWHKTGSTALQSELWRQEYNDIRSFSVLPVDGSITQLGRVKEFSDSKVSRARDFLRRWSEYKDKESKFPFVLSTEALSGNPHTVYDNYSVVHEVIAAAFQDFDVTLICYYRDLDAWKKSLYGQMIKSNATFSYTEFENIVQMSGAFERNNYYKSLVNSFGAKNVLYIDYDNIINNDIVEDFFVKTQLERSERISAEISRKNPGYSESAIDIKRLVNLKVEPEAASEAREVFDRHARFLGSQKKGEMLSDENKLIIAESLAFLINKNKNKRNWNKIRSTLMNKAIRSPRIFKILSSLEKNCRALR